METLGDQFMKEMSELSETSGKFDDESSSFDFKVPKEVADYLNSNY